MATLYKRGNVWWIGYKENNQMKYISTKQTDKENAKRLLKHYEAIEKADYLIGTPLHRITLAQWRDKYLELRKTTISKATYHKDILAIKSLLTVFSETTQLENVKDLRNWYVKYSENHAVASANSYFRHLKIFFNAAIKAGHIKDNPCKSIKPHRENESIGKTLNRQEINKILDYFNDKPAWLNLIKTALYIGARSGELCRLTVKDIDLENRTVLIRSETNNPTKNHKTRIVPIPIAAIVFFKELVRNKKDLLLLNSSNEQWQVDWISHGFKEHMDKLEISCTFHDLRKTYGAWLIMNGADLVTVKDNMGHSTITVTVKHYAHLLIEHRSAQTDKLEF